MSSNKYHGYNQEPIDLDKLDLDLKNCSKILSLNKQHHINGCTQKFKRRRCQLKFCAKKQCQKVSSNPEYTEKLKKDSQELKRHENLHTEEKPFELETCRKHFVCSDQLGTHIPLHTGERPFQCKFCHTTFKYRSNLIEHEWCIHERKKPFSSEKCDKKIMINSSKDRILRVCNKNNSSKIDEQYRKHCSSQSYAKLLKKDTQETVVKEVRKKVLVCPYCNKIFKRLKGLRCHKMLHTGQKPFECDICSKSFITKVQLKTHIRFHTGEGLFNCNFCDKSFMYKCNLTRHQRQNHEEMDYF